MTMMMIVPVPKTIVKASSYDFPNDTHIALLFDDY